MKSLILLSALTMASNSFARVDQEIECKSLITPSNITIDNSKRVVHSGPYFKKFERTNGYVDDAKYQGAYFFIVKLDGKDNFALKIRGAEAIGSGNEALVLSYAAEPNEFSSDLDIKYLTVFCSTSESNLNSTINKYVKEHFLLVKPFSELSR